MTSTPDAVRDDALLAEALARWGARPGSAWLVADGAQRVYAFASGGRRRYLRVTPADVRDGAALEAELAFVRHLHDAGLAVAAPVPSMRGADVEPLPAAPPGRWHATAFEEAPGTPFRYDPAADARPHFRRRGRLLGRLHVMARRYARDAPAAVARLPRWDEDRWLRAADALVPRSDAAFWGEHRTIMAWLRALPRDADAFGPIHGDVGATNYRVAAGRLTLFDFGDACRHWYAHDGAVSVYP